MRACNLCGQAFKDYQNKCRTRCGSCNTKIRRYRAKAAAIKFLGGKCASCAWSGNQAALQFHHTNPKEKDFIIGNVANKSWDSIKKELKKCILLCANCHSIQHSTKDGELFVKEAMKYKGKTFVL
jgi:predicted HNH restriction endonuclease